MLGAPIVRNYGIEPLPMAYIIVGHGAAAGFIGDANPIPVEKPELAAAYALAAAYLGMRFVYLEAGSGAERPIPPNFVKAVKKVLPSTVKLVVGGGIREPEQAGDLVAAGADLIVTGTIVERDPPLSKLNKIVAKILEAGRARSHTQQQ
jgi:phosphoglycerol geranylgeranyltransferase